MSEDKFFFEGDNELFNALKAAGIVEESTHEVQVEASMKQMSSKVLQLEFGTYQKNYSIHVTPIHPRRNLATDNDVDRAIEKLAITLNEYVPHTLEVKIHRPMSEWKMKVISVVIEGGANAWNFDLTKLEAECIPKLFKALEGVILS
jgi:hypothetical protein